MSTFDQVMGRDAWTEAAAQLGRVGTEDVRRTLAAEQIGPGDLPALLAPAADSLLEPMAQRARQTTRRRFGRTATLYAPLYVSNHCVNACAYCGFNCNNSIVRRTLSAAEIAAEMDHLKAAGFEHLLLVSGDHPREAPVAYLEEAVRMGHERFASVAVEVYPLDRAGYARLIEAGCDGLALYQETYDRDQYLAVHPKGWKRDFDARLRAVECAGEAGMRSLGLGALLGLCDWRVEAVCLGRHAAHLMKRFWRSRLALSFPRLCPAEGGYAAPRPVADRDLVHMMCALRLAFPDAELVVSTREPAGLRDHLMRLGVATRFSAGSRTEPGGYRQRHQATGQFDVHDQRSPAEVAAALVAAGCEPVWKDWDRAFLADPSAEACLDGRPANRP